MEVGSCRSKAYIFTDIFGWCLLMCDYAQKEVRLDFRCICVNFSCVAHFNTGINEKGSEKWKYMYPRNILYSILSMLKIVNCEGNFHSKIIQ